MHGGEDTRENSEDSERGTVRKGVNTGMACLQVGGVEAEDTRHFGQAAVQVERIHELAVHISVRRARRRDLQLLGTRHGGG